MSKASRSHAIDPKLMNLVAKRIHSRMQQLGLTQRELSERCSIAGSDLEDTDVQPSLGRERISKILMNRHDEPQESAARSMTQPEFRTLARVLRVSMEWLRGDGLHEDGVIWNILAEPERGAHLLHLMEEYEETADVTMVWSEYPLCSFTTDEFMTAFHRAHFAEVDTLGVTKDRTSLVEFFNKAGKARRKRIVRSSRTFHFVNFVFRSAIDQIVLGTGAYRAIPSHVRKHNFEHMVRLLTDKTMRMEFVVLNDERAGHLKGALRDYETVGLIGDRLTIWNYHSGTIGWTEHPRRIQYHRKLLLEMKQYALCQSPVETIQYLRHKSEEINPRTRNVRG